MSANRRIGAEVFVKATEASDTLKKVQGDVKGVGEAAVESNKAAAVAANGLASSHNAAAAATGNLLLKQQQTAQEITRVNAAIKAESASLDLMSRVSARSADAQGLLSGKIKESEDKIVSLLLQKKSLGDEATNLNQKLNGTSVAQATLSSATEKSNEGFNRLTTQIRTNGTIFQGYDGILQAVVGSTGGVTVGVGILISLAGALAPKIYELIQGKKEMIEIDRQQAAVNSIVAQTTGVTALAVQNLAGAQFASTRQNADLVASMQIILNEQETYQENNQKLNQTLVDLSSGMSRLRRGVNEFGEEIDDVTISTSGYASDIANLNKSIGEQEKAMQPALETLRQTRVLYGLNSDQVIKYAAEMLRLDASTEEGAKALGFLRQQLDADLPSLRAMISLIEGATDRMESMERGALRLKFALAQIKAPDFSISGTQEAVNQARATFNANLQAQGAAGRNGNDQFVIAAGDAKKLNDELKAYATQHAPNAKAAAAQYALSLSQLTDVERQAIARLGQVEKNQEAFSKSQNRGAAAAKAYANELVNLQRAAEQAEIALQGDSFSKREANIRSAARAEKEHLEINKRDRAEAIALIDRKENALLQGISQARIEAEDQVLAKIAQMQIGGIANERSRKLAEIDFELIQERKKLDKQFGDTLQVKNLLDLYERALKEDFNRWDNEQHRKKILEQGRATRAAIQAELQARLAADADNRKARFERSDRPGRDDAQKRLR